jgi:hypothetical protein
VSQLPLRMSEKVWIGVCLPLLFNKKTVHFNYQAAVSSGGLTESFERLSQEPMRSRPVSLEHYHRYSGAP